VDKSSPNDWTTFSVFKKPVKVYKQNLVTLLTVSEKEIGLPAGQKKIKEPNLRA
jgi:hypothetical protein